MFNSVYRGFYLEERSGQYATFWTVEELGDFGSYDAAKAAIDAYRQARVLLAQLEKG